MNLRISFRYLPEGANEPREEPLHEDRGFEFDDDRFMPLPAVGDSVTLERVPGGPKNYRVLTRQFFYSRESVTVVLVAGDISEEEMNKRF